MLNKITERVHFMSKDDELDRPVLGIIIGDKSSLVVDAGGSPDHARSFLAMAEELKPSPIKYMVITHYHWDHIFGIPAMEFTAIAPMKTKELMNNMKKIPWDNAGLQKRLEADELGQFNVDCIKKEMPDEKDRIIGDCDIYFNDSMEIDLGNTTCIIEHVGGSHTDDSAVIYVPEEKVMFLGDCIYGRRYNKVYGYKLETLVPMIEKIRKYDAEYYVISHEELQTKEQINEFFDAIVEMGKLVDKDTDIDKVTKKYQEIYGNTPDEEKMSYINCFINVNKALE